MLVNRYDISRFIEITDLHKKIETLATRSQLKPEQDKLQTTDLNRFICEGYLVNDEAQNYFLLYFYEKFILSLYLSL